MRKEENYWRRFEQTGGVLDYLNYTACAREPYAMPEDYDMPEAEEMFDLCSDEYEEEDEVESDDRDAHGEWNGALGYAGGRIR